MWLKKLAIAAGATALTAGAAGATVDKGWYIGLEAGVNEATDLAFAAVRLPAPAVAAGDLQQDFGWAGFATAGYAFDNNWRVELELGFRTNDIEAACLPGCFPTTGSIDQFSQMLNVIYDWDLADDWTLSTGLGIGGDFVDVSSVFGADDDYVLAYQAVIGLSHHLTDRLDVTLNYRYFNTDDLTLVSADPTFPGQTWAAATDGAESHAITIGLRWDLHPSGQPSGPKDIGPPQPGEPAKQFIVFFGFNKANLTSEAQSVVAEAAAAAKKLGSAVIKVTGHTDTVGGNAYNERLSMRRADVVRDELVRLGVTSKILASGRGETQLLVQTADGVKEPQNRRTTIELD
jgi:outer membrane protein OmpA-like peptidoglycan-associated protein